MVKKVLATAQILIDAFLLLCIMDLLKKKIAESAGQTSKKKKNSGKSILVHL